MRQQKAMTYALYMCARRKEILLDFVLIQLSRSEDSKIHICRTQAYKWKKY